jgi:glycosyltransferase involved in cell wall biosynthesis
MGRAVSRLRDDLALRERLAEKAYKEVMAHYTWAARAGMILRKIESAEYTVQSTEL